VGGEADGIKKVLKKKKRRVQSFRNSENQNTPEEGKGRTLPGEVRKKKDQPAE